MEYTVEVYKKDARKREGERLVNKIDVQASTVEIVEATCQAEYPASKGFRYAIFETYVTRTNLMGGAEYKERYDTPRYCSPSSEAYWSM